MFPCNLKAHRVAALRRIYITYINSVENKLTLISGPCISVSCRSFNTRQSQLTFAFAGYHRNKHAYLRYGFIFKTMSTRPMRKSADERNTEMFEKQFDDLDISLRELARVAELFPSPTHTLSNIKRNTSEEMFSVFYEQLPLRDTEPKKFEWQCTYKLHWPMKFNIVRKAPTKALAQNKATLVILHRLLYSKHIDEKGRLVHQGQEVSRLMENLNPPVELKIGNDNCQAIEAVMQTFAQDVEPVFERAKNKWNPTLLSANLESYTELTDEAENFEEIETSNKQRTYVTDHNMMRDPISMRPLQEMDFSKKDPDKEKLQANLDLLLKNPEKHLPIDDYFATLQERIARSPGGAFVLVGPPGSGKSTRAPLWAALYDAHKDARIVVTEPRRVAASSLADRVADDLNQEVGINVGYRIRLSHENPSNLDNCILFCTSGVLLRTLYNNPGLLGCTHVFVDEAHERDINTDIMMLLLKRAMSLNNDLKVIIMSATINTRVFTSYFGDCPVIEIAGAVHSVMNYYLEDFPIVLGNLKLPKSVETSKVNYGSLNVAPHEVASLIQMIDHTQRPGAILAFLPGWMDIRRTMDSLNELYGNSSRINIIPVHSRLPKHQQNKMFTPAELGVRKVVLATNIAETSITVPDVVFVVDSGAVKQYIYKGRNGICALQTNWISRSSMQQRSGRAGRVQPGTAFRMYTKERAQKFHEHTLPEIQRVPLVKTVLDCKLYSENEKAIEVMSLLPEAPHQIHIEEAVAELQELGALNQEERLTGLGRMISQFMLQPRLSKSLVHSVVFRTVQPILNVITIISNPGNIFQNSLTNRARNRALKRTYQPVSDHLSFHWIMEDFMNKANSMKIRDLEHFYNRKGLKLENLRFLKSLSKTHFHRMCEVGLMDYSSWDQMGNLSNNLNMLSIFDEVSKAVLFSGVASLIQDKTYLNTVGRLERRTILIDDRGSRIIIPNESCNAFSSERHQPTSSDDELQTTKNGTEKRLLIATDSRAMADTEGTRLLVASQTTLVTPLTVLLMADGDVNVEPLQQNFFGTGEQLVNIHITKHQLSLQTTQREADLLMSFRTVIKAVLDYHIEHGGLMQKNPENEEAVEQFMGSFLRCFAKLLTQAENNLKVEIKDD